MSAEEQTGREPEASVATDVTSLPDVMVTGMTQAVTSSPADDDERSLDENLRPMDGQIWLPDVDGELMDAFQTMV